MALSHHSSDTEGENFEDKKEQSIMNRIAYYNAKDSIHQAVFTNKRQPLQTLLESEEDSARSVCEEIKGYGV